MKKHNGWKVLLKDRVSISHWEGTNPWALEYPIGLKVFPYENSKLFFFKYKKNALEFVKYNKDAFLVVKCVATNPVKFQGFICKSSSSINKFWAELYNVAESKISGSRFGSMVAPEGTWVADSITCLE